MGAVRKPSVATDAAGTIIRVGKSAPVVVTVLSAGRVVIDWVVVANTAPIDITGATVYASTVLVTGRVVVGGVGITNAAFIGAGGSTPDIETVFGALCIVVGRVVIANATIISGRGSVPSSSAILEARIRTGAAADTVSALVFKGLSAQNAITIDHTSGEPCGTSHAISTRIDARCTTNIAVTVRSARNLPSRATDAAITSVGGG